MPDEAGTVVSFPDDMPKEQIRALIEKKFPHVARGPATAPPEASGGQPAPSGPDRAQDAPAPSLRQKLMGLIRKVGRGGKVVLDQGLQGATANFADEVTDLIGSGIASAATGVPYGEILPGARESTRQELERQQNDHKIVSALSQIGGAVAAGGIASRLPGIGAGVQAVTKALPGVAGEAAVGAIAGAPSAAIYAAGNAPQGQRADAARNAALPGAVGGAVLAPVAGALGNVASNTLGPLSQKAAAYIQRKSAARQMMESHLRTHPDLPGAIATAQGRFSKSREMGVPLALGEAMDDNSMMRTLATLKERPETAMRTQQFLEGRAAAVPGAIDKLIDEIHPTKTADEAGAELIRAGKDKIDQLHISMQSEAQPYYDQAREEFIPKTAKVLQSFEVKKAIAKARDEYPDEIADAAKWPDNSLNVLHHAKKVLDAKLAKAVRDEDGGKIKYLTEVKDRLMTEMKKNPSYQEANRIYNDDMPEIDLLQRGRIGRLTGLRRQGAETATAELFKGSPTATREMVDAVGPGVAREAGAGELRRIADVNKNDPLTFANKVMGPTPSKAAQEQWKTVLGNKYEPFIQKLDIIRQANRGKTFTEGSRTEPMKIANQALDEGAKGTKDKLQAGDLINPLGAMGKIGRRLARAMQDPQAESKYLNDVADYLMTPKGEQLLADLQKAKTPASRRIALNNLQKGLIAGTTGGKLNETKPLRITVRPEKTPPTTE